MLESRSQVAAVIARYVAALEGRGVEVDRVYLFGSYLRGTANEWSDIDVVVVSPAGTGEAPWELAPIVGAARHEVFRATGESVEALVKAPEEVARCHPASFLADVLRDAVVLYEREPAPV